MKNFETQFGLVDFDFERFFPHKFWVSDWATDDSYPGGYCYKVLSVRDEVEGKVEIVLVRAQPDGVKEELHRAWVPAADDCTAANIFVRGLTQKFQLDFEEQDFTTARTLEDFDVLTHKYGWSMRPVN